MRKLIVSSLVSLDGIHGDPQSWIGDYFDQQAAEESLAVLLDSDAMLMGKTTYQYFAPAFSPPSGPYLERINEMRKYVFSSTLAAADWTNTTIVRSDPAAAVQELKQQGDGHLVIYGYGQLAQTLLEHGLVDLLNFVVIPVLVGSGATLFRPASARICAWFRSPSAATARSPCPTQTPEGRQADRQGSPSGANQGSEPFATGPGGWLLQLPRWGEFS